MGCQALHRQNIFEVTKRPMQELSLKKWTGLSSWGDGEHFGYLSRQDRKSGLCTDEQKLDWQKLELHITALGKALLARKTREELDYFLEALTLTPHTRNTFTDKNCFWKNYKKHAFGDGP